MAENQTQTEVSDRTPRSAPGAGDVDIVPVEDGETLSLHRLTHNDIDRHGLYGLDSSHGWGGKRQSVAFTGSARRLLENRAIALAKSRHPHGIMTFALTGAETVVQLDRQLPARALYCEITRLLNGRSIDKRQRKSLHRVRDAIVDHAENPDLSGGCSEFPPWDPTVPITTDDRILRKAKDRADPDKKERPGFAVEQIELTDERPGGL